MPLPTGVSFLAPTLPVYVFDAKEPGPTALIQGGIHGNEVAGTHALQELLEEGITPKRGRLIIIPVMNPAAYRARQRMAPGGLDLNRCFPGASDAPEAERRLAARFMALVEDEKPLIMATLHESLKRFHPEVPQSFGQTLVYGVKPMPQIIERVVARMNETLQHPYEVWAPHYYPVATSSTEVIVDKVGCIGICVETWEVFEERRRIDMQRLVVKYLLEDVGVL
jgi:hypothetical protein